jgi:hypothetical protein
VPRKIEGKYKYKEGYKNFPVNERAILGGKWVIPWHVINWLPFFVEAYFEDARKLGVVWSR